MWGSILTEWLSLIFRWLHVVAGIAWIGSSFYFIHLDLSLKPNSALPEGVQGEAWQVHGGGFYRIVKYLVAPAQLPDELTWFKWEAYTTWLSGFALMVVVYYLDAELFLVDNVGARPHPIPAGLFSFCSLVLAAGSLYEAACRSPARPSRATSCAASAIVFLVGLDLWLHPCVQRTRRVHSDRRDIGTIMVANVFL